MLLDSERPLKGVTQRALEDFTFGAARLPKKALSRLAMIDDDGNLCAAAVVAAQRLFRHSFVPNHDDVPFDIELLRQINSVGSGLYHLAEVSGTNYLQESPNYALLRFNDIIWDESPEGRYVRVVNAVKSELSARQSPQIAGTIDSNTNPCCEVTI